MIPDRDGERDGFATFDLGKKHVYGLGGGHPELIEDFFHAGLAARIDPGAKNGGSGHDTKEALLCVTSKRRQRLARKRLPSAAGHVRMNGAIAPPVANTSCCRFPRLIPWYRAPANWIRKRRAIPAAQRRSRPPRHHSPYRNSGITGPPSCPGFNNQRTDPLGLRLYPARREFS